MEVIRISHPTGELNGLIDLERSKSLSNRYLIIRSLCKQSFEINGLSDSDDSQILNRLLDSRPDENIYDVYHAGTSFRFLTAYLSIQPGKQILTGSHRMKERPIGSLVDALRSLGCQIEYMEKEGFPPLSIGPPVNLGQRRHIEIDAGISSQFLSALLMIGPRLPNGLKLEFKGDLVSESYLNMTLKTIGQFGVNYQKEKNTIDIPPQDYQPVNVEVEADWSASSYFFACAALAKQANIQLRGLFENSVQGDSAMTLIGEQLGIRSQFDNGLLNLSRNEDFESFSYDFINQPDLAQTVAVICAASKVSGQMTGLKTLRIKETDRISALNTELQKVGSGFNEHVSDNNEFRYSVVPNLEVSGIPRFSTYHDHRMAMALAPLALKFPIEIEDPNVVSKSYPGFWKDLQSLGFVVSEVK